MSTEQAPALSSAEVAARLRLANDSIAKGAVSFDGERLDFEFFCECGDSRCHEVVWLTVVQYRVARFWPVLAHATPQAAHSGPYKRLVPNGH